MRCITRLCARAHLLAACLLSVQLCTPPLHAQPQPQPQGRGGYDYYAPRVTTEEIQTLSTVEHHHLGPGLQEIREKRYHQAQGSFEFILRYYPNHPQALTQLTNMCVMSNEYCKVAEDWFQKALALNPNAAPTHLLYGLYHHRKKRFHEAVKEYQRAIELAPDDANSHYNLGIALIDLKQYDQANQHAQKSYELGANMPGLRTRLEKLGKWKPAAVVTPPSGPTRQ